MSDFKGRFLDKSKVFTNGVLVNNPVFRLVLGTCPTLAVTTGAIYGLFMGIITTIVLVCVNIIISLLKSIIPDKVRIPAYVLIIATFVTALEMLLKRYFFTIYSALGIFLPLIVVNCLIFARAEAFASTNKVLDSALDGLGMGIGFTASLTLIGLVREFFGAGTLFLGDVAGRTTGIAIPGMSDYTLSVLTLPAGGFLVFGLLMAAVNYISGVITNYREKKSKEAALRHVTKMLEGEELHTVQPQPKNEGGNK